MATSEERLKILKMIQEGKITAEEGMQLFKALEESAKKQPEVSKDQSRGKGRAFFSS